MSVLTEQATAAVTSSERLPARPGPGQALPDIHSHGVWAGAPSSHPEQANSPLTSNGTVPARPGPDQATADIQPPCVGAGASSSPPERATVALTSKGNVPALADGPDHTICDIHVHAVGATLPAGAGGDRMIADIPQGRVAPAPATNDHPSPDQDWLAIQLPGVGATLPAGAGGDHRAHDIHTLIVAPAPAIDHHPGPDRATPVIQALGVGATPPTPLPGQRMRDIHATAAGDGRVAATTPKRQRTDKHPSRRQQARETFADVTDLDSLHALMGHHARLFRDAQQVRIAQENRIRAMREKDKLPEQTLAVAEDVAQQALASEKDLEEAMRELARRHPLADWLAGVYGIDLASLCRILGITGPLDNFASPAKLWKYLGLHVVEGQRPRRRKGQQLVPTKHHLGFGKDDPLCHAAACQHPDHREGTAFAPAGQALAHLLGRGFKLAGHDPTGLRRSTYHTLYRERKAQVLARPLRRGPSGCPLGEEPHRNEQGKVAPCVHPNAEGGESSAHCDNDALRYAAKRFVKDLWHAWHRVIDGQACDRCEQEALP